MAGWLSPEDLTELTRVLDLGGVFANGTLCGVLAQDIPVNHSSRFAPVLQPTLDTGARALVTATLTRLARQSA
ncbi:hypothetical protein [Streptomyces sp. NPDC002386]